VLTIAVTWFIVDRVGLSLDALGDLEAEAWLPRPGLLLAASVLLLAAYFVSAWIWGLMVRDLGGPRIPGREAVQLFMIANLGRYIPGKVWQIAGLAALARGKGVPAATATGAAVLGHGIALVAASTLGLGALLTGPEPYRTWGIVGAVVVAIVLVLVSIPAVFRRLADLWLRMTKTETSLGALHGARWLGLYILNWTMYVLSFWVLSCSLGLQGGVVPLASGFAAAYVLGYLMVFAPAGLGPREGFLIMFLTPHIGVTSSGLLAVVARLWMTVVEVVPAAIFWSRHVTRAGDASPARAGEGTDA
jgi:hypothetical protein